jgi:hypothetical protein
MDNKELMSQEELSDIMFDYIKPELDKCYSSDGFWTYGFPAGAFCWNLVTGVGNRNRIIGSREYKDHLDIHNGAYFIEGNVNIKVFEDHVEFIEDSEFNDFDKEFMHGLYLKIKEFVEGNNIKEENK